MPKGSSKSIKALILSSSPVISITSDWTPTSTMLARKRWTISTISPRVLVVAFTLMRASSRDTMSSSEISETRTTSMSLSSCLVAWSTVYWSPSTTKVMRDSPGCSLLPTARLAMMMPVSTHLENPLRYRFFHHFMHRLTGGNHGVNVLILLNDEVHHHRAGNIHGLLNSPGDLGLIGDADSGNAISLGNFYEVWIAGVDSGKKVFVVEEVLPLAHHAQSAVIQNGELD